MAPAACKCACPRCLPGASGQTATDTRRAGSGTSRCRTPKYRGAQTTPSPLLSSYFVLSALLFLLFVLFSEEEQEEQDEANFKDGGRAPDPLGTLAKATRILLI